MTDVVFFGLKKVMPLMTEGLLAYPLLSSQYFSLVRGVACFKCGAEWNETRRILGVERMAFAGAEIDSIKFSAVRARKRFLEAFLR